MTFEMKFTEWFTSGNVDLDWVGYNPETVDILKYYVLRGQGKSHAYAYDFSIGMF